MLALKIIVSSFMQRSCAKNSEPMTSEERVQRPDISAWTFRPRIMKIVNRSVFDYTLSSSYVFFHNLLPLNLVQGCSQTENEERKMYTAFRLQEWINTY